MTASRLVLTALAVVGAAAAAESPVDQTVAQAAARVERKAAQLRRPSSTRRILERPRTPQEFPQNFGALVTNPFAFSVLPIARSGIAPYGSIDPETSLTY
jgi:hypothetical protein